MASAAYTAAKMAARLAKAKKAHDDLISAVFRTQADALEIEAGAKRRLADEYDAAQARGEIQKPGGDRKTIVAKNNNGPKVEDYGLSRPSIHEARIIRDAEQEEPASSAVFWMKQLLPDLLSPPGTIFAAQRPFNVILSKFCYLTITTVGFLQS